MSPVPDAREPSSSALARLSALAARWPIAAILLLVAAQQILTLNARDLWWSDEVRHAAVLTEMLDSGQWLALRLNGALYPDKPPLYFWFLGALASLFGSTDPSVLLTGLALTVAAYHLATYALARVLGWSTGQGLAAVAVLATMPYVLATAHYARMDFLFGAFIALAWAGLYRGCRPGGSPRAMLLGFAAAAIATLIKGPLGALLPLAGLIAALAWQGRLRRLVSLDVALGLLLPLLANVAWLGALWQATSTDYIAQLFQSQIVRRALTKVQDPLDRARYLVTFPLVLLPWTLLPVQRFSGPVALFAGAQRIWRDRRQQDPAMVFLFAQIFAGLLVLTAVREKHEYYLLPLLIPAALVAGRSFMTASETIQRRFIIAAGLVFSLLAVAPPLVDAAGAIPYETSGLLPAGLVLLVGSLTALTLRHQARLALGAFVLTLTLWGNVLALRVMPSLDAALSPRTLTDAITAIGGDKADVAAFWSAPGTLRYHLGRPYADEFISASLRSWLDKHPEGVILVSLSAMRFIPDVLPVATEVRRVHFAGDTIVFLRRRAPAGPATP